MVKVNCRFPAWKDRPPANTWNCSCACVVEKMPTPGKANVEVRELKTAASPSEIAGVASAHVEGALGPLVVEIDDGADAENVMETVRDVVNSAAADLAAAGREPQIRTAPFADPGNPLAVLVPLTAAAFDALAISAAVTGWVIRLPAAPRTTRAAAALLNNQPRMIAVLESRLGRVGTDLVLSASTAAANGLTQAVGTPMLNLVERVLQISEAEAHRRRWRDPGRSWPPPLGRRLRSSPSFRQPAPKPKRPGIIGQRPRPVKPRMWWSTDRSTPPSTPRKDRWPGRSRTTSIRPPTVR